jgi:hypothetical protein
MTAYQKMGWSSIGKGLLKSGIYFTYKHLFGENRLLGGYRQKVTGG